MSARPSYGTGAASAARIHDAMRAGSIKLAPTQQRREPMTADPLRLDSGIPTLTERHAARHHRSVPYLHLVHRVDTATDLPAGIEGAAVGHMALNTEADAEDLYQPKPIYAAHTSATARAQAAQIQFDRRARRTIAGVYLVAGILLALVVVGARHQTEIRAALKAAAGALKAAAGAFGA